MPSGSATGQVFLDRRLREALERLNPAFPAEAIEDAFPKLRRSQGTDLVKHDRSLHRILAKGVTVEYRTRDGESRAAQARVIDHGDPAANDILAVNQFTVAGNRHTPRPCICPSSSACRSP